MGRAPARSGRGPLRSRSAPRAALPLLLLAGCPRPARPLGDDREAVRVEIDAWTREALGPARVPPPSVTLEPRTATVDGVTVTAVLVRPEDQPWNAWDDGTSRVLDNRGALMFETTIEGDGALTWKPAETTLEVNDTRLVLTAAPSAETLLEPLILHAWLAERWSIDVDLADRARAAGPFRAAWLPTRADDGRLAGLVAFPMGLHADDHVVALRLTLTVELDGRPVAVQLVFD